MTNCLKVNKRQEWVDYPFEKHRITLKNQYKEKKLNKIEKKLPKNINSLTAKSSYGGENTETP